MRVISKQTRYKAANKLRDLAEAIYASDVQDVDKATVVEGSVGQVSHGIYLLGQLENTLTKG